ncbi:MAG: CRISPR-associated endonuclease Cas2 [Nitrospirae bacterium]|nr:MAG: CRISPR-associated endonuclease Cas2 [Nitrospirota bacterium]
MIVCVAYDIGDDKARNRVSLMLAKKGVRLQKSVFLIELKQKELKTFARKLRRMVSNKDAIALFPLCARCRGDAIQINCYSPEGVYVF